MKKKKFLRTIVRYGLVTITLFFIVSGVCFADIDWKQFSGTEITVMSWIRPMTEVGMSLIPEFEDKTGIKVNWIVMDAWELRAKVAREYALGTPTMDAWFYHPSQQELWIQAGNYQVDQMEYINDPSLTPADWDFDDFLPVGKLGNRVFSKDNKGAYSLSLTSQPTGLWYRKDLFDEYNISVPKTFEDLEQAAKKLTLDTNGDGKIDIYGLVARGQGFQSVTRIGGFIFGYGGAWWTHDRKSAIDKPETLRGIMEYSRLLKTYGPPNTAELGWLEVAQFFADGKAAMVLISGEHAPLFENPEKSAVVGKVAMAPYPAGPAGQAVITELLSMGIPREAKNKEAAWLFGQWLMNKENTKKAIEGGAATVRTSAWNDPNVKRINDSWGDYIKYSLEVGDDHFVNLACIPLTEVREVWGQVIDYAILGEPDLEDYAHEKAQEINGIITRTEGSMYVDIPMNPKFCYMPYDIYRPK